MLKNSSWKSDIKEVLKTSIPLTGSMLSGLLMMIVDRIALSRYSELTLAASGPAIYCSITVITFFTALAGISRIFVARAKGKNDKEEMALSALAGIVVSIALALLYLLFSPLLALLPSLSSRATEVKALEVQYMRLASLFGLFIVINSGAASIFNGLLKTKVTFIVALAGNIINSICTVGLVFGYAGLPELGMRGSAYGTLIAAISCSLGYLFLLVKTNPFQPLAKEKSFLPSTINMLKVGVPSAAAQTMDEAAQAAFVWIVGGVGISGLAANNVGLAVNYLIIIPLVGLGLGTNILIAHRIGSGESKGSWRVIKASLFIAALYITIVALLELLFTPYIVLPFISSELDEGTLKLSYSVVRVLFSYAIAFALSMVMGGALEAVGKTGILFWVRTIVMWGLTLPIIYFIVRNNIGRVELVPLYWLIFSLFELIIGLTYGAIFYLKGHKETDLNVEENTA